MMANSTFLSFLLFSMCHSIHVAVNTWLNCIFYIILCIDDVDCENPASILPEVHFLGLDVNVQKLFS